MQMQQPMYQPPMQMQQPVVIHTAPGAMQMHTQDASLIKRTTHTHTRAATPSEQGREQHDRLLPLTCLGLCVCAATGVLRPGNHAIVYETEIKQNAKCMGCTVVRSTLGMRRAPPCNAQFVC